MDVILLQFYLSKRGVDNRMLRESMGWSDVTRRTRMNAGRGWKVAELQVLMTLGFTRDEIYKVFFREVKK